MTCSKKRLPVRIELDKRGIDLHSVCFPLCDDDLESMDHTLTFCNLAQEVWSRVFKWWNRGNFSSFLIKELIRGNTTIDSNIWLVVLWVTSYLICKYRNNMVFRGKGCNALVALSEIQAISFDWILQRIKGIKIDWNIWL
ncbi:uncharacterized protein [Rutidosis leptorrhynchoides]|uniref:uncharacterized protein n=1 Tax=Rutidosis leptorrhynchoides TaxID=125765 RepID=UPI003A997D14